MRMFSINFLKNNKKILDEKKHIKNYDGFCEIGKLIKEARIQNNLSIRELSKITRIPESSINAIENNIKDLRPKDPFLRSILFKLEKCLALKNNSLVGLVIKERNTFEKNKKKYTLRKFDFLNSLQASIFYFFGMAFSIIF